MAAALSGCSFSMTFPWRADWGREVRIRELYRALPDGYDIILLCLHDEVDEKSPGSITGSFRSQSQNPSTFGSRTRALSVKCQSGTLLGRHCLRNRRFRELLNQQSKWADVVVFEHPYLAPLLDDIPDDKPVIYSSLNAETEIKQRLLQGRVDYQRCMAELWRGRAVSQRAGLIVAVT
jgi:hypothetical protein